MQRQTPAPDRTQYECAGGKPIGVPRECGQKTPCPRWSNGYVLLGVRCRPPTQQPTRHSAYDAPLPQLEAPTWSTDTEKRRQVNLGYSASSLLHFPPTSYPYHWPTECKSVHIWRRVAIYSPPGPGHVMWSRTLTAASRRGLATLLSPDKGHSCIVFNPVVGSQRSRALSPLPGASILSNLRTSGGHSATRLLLLKAGSGQLAILSHVLVPAAPYIIPRRGWGDTGPFRSGSRRRPDGMERAAGPSPCRRRAEGEPRHGPVEAQAPSRE